MPCRLSLRAVSRLSLRRHAARQSHPFCQRRCYTDERPVADRPFGNSPRQENERTGPNMEQAPHVSEEAAAMSKMKGESGPQIEEKGTPAHEVSPA